MRLRRRHHRTDLHLRSDRGASLVEYSLIFSLVVVATIGALDYVGGGLQAGITEMEAGVEAGPPKKSNSGGELDGGGGIATTSTTAGGIVTTTTTAQVTTTTAAPTTTTTAPPTTTTTAPRPGYDGPTSSSFTETRSWRDGDSHWKSRAVIELRDQSGTAIPSGATVRIKVTERDRSGGQWHSDTSYIEVEVVDGRIVIEDRHRTSGSYDVDEIHYEIVNITFDDPEHPGWDGDGSKVVIEDP